MAMKLVVVPGQPACLHVAPVSPVAAAAAAAAAAVDDAADADAADADQLPARVHERVQPASASTVERRRRRRDDGSVLNAGDSGGRKTFIGQLMKGGAIKC